MTLGGRRIEVRRPRVRSVDDTEVRLESYDTFASVNLNHPGIPGDSIA